MHQLIITFEQSPDVLVRFSAVCYKRKITIEKLNYIDGSPTIIDVTLNYEKIIIDNFINNLKNIIGVINVEIKSP